MKISDTPKNHFKELDKLEAEEHLDHIYNRYTNSDIDPMTATPYNALFTFPAAYTGFPNTPTGLPAAAPFYDYKERKPEEYRD